MELKICHLYPDVLNLYGDRGNILCMRRRLEWRGIGFEITELPLGVRDDLTSYDLFFIGGGQDFEQTVLLSDLSAGRAANIRSAAEDGKPFLCVCGGYQLLGAGYRTADGQMCEYTGIIDLTTEGSPDRVLKGYGNNGSDGTEGVRWNNVYGTYSHGPVLPKNPEFCDHILGTALERKYGVRDLAPLDDRAENAAREVMLRRLHVN